MWAQIERNASCEVNGRKTMENTKVSDLRVADKDHPLKVHAEGCLNNKNKRKKKQKEQKLNKTQCIESPTTIQQDKHSHKSSDTCLPDGIPRYINVYTEAKTKTPMSKSPRTSLTPTTSSDQSFRKFQDLVRNSKDKESMKQRLKNLSVGFQHLAHRHQDLSIYQPGTIRSSSPVADHIDANAMLETIMVSIVSKAGINNSNNIMPDSKEENKYGRGEKSLSKSDAVRKMHAEYYASQVARSMVLNPKSIPMSEFNLDLINIRQASFLDNY